MVTTELAERVAAFDDAVAELAEQITRWDTGARLVVLDTNVYLEHRDLLEQLDIAKILGALEAPIRVLVPMTVLDELDSAKRRRDEQRGRAVQALAVIDRVARGSGVLRERDLAALGRGGAPVSGQITLEVLSEPPDHVRLPNPDAEIVEQARAVQVAAGTQVTLATFDTAMAFRAHAAGLKDHKLSDRDRSDPRPGSKNRGAS